MNNPKPERWRACLATYTRHGTRPRNGARGIAADLLPHVEVNCIADYYNIPGLIEEANANIRYILQTCWPPDGFSDVIEAALNTTGDKKLMEIIKEAITDHIHELIDREDFIELEMMNGFMTNVIRRLMTECIQLRDELRRPSS